PSDVTVARCFDELLKSKRVGNRRAVYIKSLTHYLGRFCSGRELTPVAQITPVEIEKWLAQFPLPISRQTWLNRISTLFSFAVRRGYIASHPCDNIERVIVDRKPPLVLSPSESR